MINKLAKKTFGEKNKSVKALNSKVILLKKHHHAIAHKKHTGARKAIKHAKKKIVLAKKTHKAYKKGKATKHEAKKAEKSAKKAIKKVIKAHPKYVAHVAIRKANKKVHLAKIMKWHYKHGLVSKHALKKAVHNAQKAIHKARKLAKSSKVLHKHKSHHHAAVHHAAHKHKSHHHAAVHHAAHKHKSHHHAAVHHAAKKHHKKAPNGFPVSQHGWSNWEKKQDSFLKANQTLSAERSALARNYLNWQKKVTSQKKLVEEYIKKLTAAGEATPKDKRKHKFHVKALEKIYVKANEKLESLKAEEAKSMASYIKADKKVKSHFKGNSFLW